MKFRMTMKDPDALDDAIRDAVRQTSVIDAEDDEERDAIWEMRSRKIRSLCSKWFKWGEYLTVEIDTEAQTCVVVAET